MLQHTSVLTRIVEAIAVATMTAAAAGCTGAPPEGPNETPTPITIPESIPAAEEIQYVLDTGPQEEHVFAMQWSASGDLWFVGTGSDDQMSLNRYSPQTRRHERWDIPTVGSLGPHTYLVQESEGIWWIAAGYTLVLYDSSKSTELASRRFETGHALETLEGPEPGGTWINGLLRDGSGDLLLTRNHVRAVFEVGEDGSLSVHRELESGPAGLALARGQAIGGDSAKAAMGSGGQAYEGLFAEMNSCDVVLDFQSGKTLITAGGSSRATAALLPAGAAAGWKTILAVSGDGTRFGAAIGDGSTIVRGDCSPANTEVFQLAVSYTRDEPLHAPLAARNGTPPIRRTTTPVVALAVSPAGAVAFSDSRGRIGLVE